MLVSVNEYFDVIFAYIPYMMKTLVLGASTNPERYSYKAIMALRSHGIETVAVGNKEGQLADVMIHKGATVFEHIDTITIYLSAKNQRTYYDYILGLKPRRIIFNPGAENGELALKATQASIETMNACTLVMLATAQY